MKVKQLGEEVVIVVTDPAWAEKFADFATQIANGATISHGKGFYNSLASSVIKEDVWLVTSFVKNAIQFNMEIVNVLRKYLQDTKEESVLYFSGGKAKLYYLDEGEKYG